MNAPKSPKRRLMDLIESRLGDVREQIKWARTPLPEFDGQTPAQLIQAKRFNALLEHELHLAECERLVDRSGPWGYPNPPRPNAQQWARRIRNRA